MIWVFILSLVLFNLFVCWFYCSYKKRKSFVPAQGVELSAIEYSPANNQCEVEVKKRGPIKAIIARLVFPLFESVLRLNLAITGVIPSHTIRNGLYRYIYKVDLGKNSVLYYGAEIRAPWNLHIGEGTIIGDKAILDARSGIYIGNNVNFSTGVWIWTLQHNVNSPSFGVDGEGKAVVIHDRVWVSCRTVILPGVEIGEGATVAAGAVVTKSLGEFKIYGGVPAKEIGSRNSELTYSFDGGHMHFL